MKRFAVILLIVLPLGDLCWNLANLNIGLVDFYGLAAFARNFAEHQVWPATPYFPAGYPFLIALGGKLGSALVAGYVLSAAGSALMLWAVFRFLRHMGAGYGWAMAAVCLAWVSPTCRIVAGNPSVDALFTGLGLWFLVAAVAIWGEAGEEVLSRPAWIRYGLVLPALALPLLRYHGLLVILPVLAILLLGRQRAWRLTAVAIVAAFMAAGFNTFTYQRAFQEPMASATDLQIRTGIEITQSKYYDSADELFAGYKSFSETARKTSILTEYTGGEVAANTLANLVKFMRRAPVAVALLLLIALPLFRKRIPSWFGIGMAWVACYALAISVAYYSPRGALLPVVFSLVLLAAIVQYLSDLEQMKYVQAAVVIMLLAGFGVSVSYAKLVIDDRLRHHYASSVVACSLEEQEINDLSTVYAEDMALRPRTGSRWCSPYGTLSQSWLHDVAIKQAQRSGIEYRPLDYAVLPGSGVSVIISNGGGPGDRLLANLPGWRFTADIAGYRIYRRIE